MQIQYTDIIMPDSTGVYYKMNGIYRSKVNHQEKTVTKNTIGFGKDVDLAYECLELWKEQGYRGSPSSPASFFRKKFHKQIRTNMCASANNMLGAYFHGGWIEAWATGAVLGEIFHYDINKAYLWAGSMGFPTKIYPYAYGDKNYVGIARMKECRGDLPGYFQSPTFIVTSEDIEVYGLNCEIIDGISWNTLDFTPETLFADLDFLPEKAFKLLTQSYWGIWASMNPLQGESVDGEQVIKSWESYNHLKNLVFATLTVHRVMAKVWMQARIDGILVFVDSVLKRSMIATGENIGDWKNEGIYKKGVYIVAPGVWDTLPVARKKIDWYRHSGIPLLLK